MALRLDFKNDVTKAIGEVEGSDGRMNVSARADARAYYNSRDRQRTYGFTFFHNEAVATEIVVALQNTSTTLTLVVSDLTINSDELGQIEVHLGTPTTLAGGQVAANPPQNENLSGGAASAIIREGTSGSGITGTTSTGRIAFEQVSAAGHLEVDFHDTVRLAQDQAIHIVYLLGTTGDVWGTIHGFFE